MSVLGAGGGKPHTANEEMHHTWIDTVPKEDSIIQLPHAHEMTSIVRERYGVGKAFFPPVVFLFTFSPDQ